MKLIKGYPDKMIFETSLHNVITVTCSKDYVNINYLKVANKEKTDYIIKETQNEKLIMNK